MDSVYRLQGVEFEWDTNKFQINLEKHGVSFEEAAEVFFDPFYQEGDATANANSVTLSWVTPALNAYYWLFM